MRKGWWVLLVAVCLWGADTSVVEYYDRLGGEIDAEKYQDLLEMLKSRCPDIRNEVNDRFLSDNKISLGEYREISYRCEMYRRQDVKEALSEYLRLGDQAKEE